LGAPNEKEGTGKTDKGVIDTQASYAIPLALDVFDETINLTLSNI
jgi:hypothetical protein